MIPKRKSESTDLQNSRLKAMTIPREHGAWGMLLIPLLTGAVVAAAAPIDVRGLAIFVIAALALFWLRTPVEAWLGSSAIKAHTPQERAAVLRLAIILTIVAISAVVALFMIGYIRGLLIIGAISGAAFVIQAAVKRIGRSGRMPAQVIGAIGLTSTSAGAYYVATGRLDRTAMALWLANWLFAGNQVHFVQVRIHAGRAATAKDKFRQGYAFFVGQFLLLVVIAVLIWLHVFPKLVVLAFVPALLRGTLWFVRGPRPLNVHRLGFEELAQALAFGALLCLVFLL
jgi:hypothetical protein